MKMVELYTFKRILFSQSIWITSACLVLSTTFFLNGCHTPDALETGLFMKEKEAYWIEDGSLLPQTDSLFYLEHPAPMFRKEFTVHKKVDHVRLFITAAGYYQATLNGKNIGKNVLDPAWTDYSKRIFYSEYDVTSMINQDLNCIGVVLGNGFYNPLPLRKWGRRNLRNDLSKVGKPTFIAKLIIDYADGNHEEVVSDTTWKFAPGPIRKNDVYLGVVYDSRKELPNWDLPGYMDESWNRARMSSGPGGDLQKTFFPPVQITDEITPVEITSPSPGIYIVDMGINFTGTFNIKCSGIAGDTITFRFGERLYEDGTLNPMTTVAGQIKRRGVGGPGAPAIAWQTDSYIISDSVKKWFSPPFTYHTYRYMEISGIREKPKTQDIKGLFFNSNVSQENRFSCSNPLLNSIQEATVRTFLANLISVQSDCPAREKFGYGGDLNATSESFIYNFDMQSFYRKTIYDWIDAMNDSTFVDTAPFTGIKYCGISWESAFLITQYYHYLYYKDFALIKELYPLNKKWMEKVARIHPNGLVEQGLSDHESLEPVPVQLTGTCHYLQCARIMSIFAKKMEDDAMQIVYETLADKLLNIVKTKYWDQPDYEDINRQTLFSTLLYHDIIPKSEIESAKDSLLHALRKGPSGHFNTGIFGTKYVLESASRYLSPQVVFEIVNSRAYPGWGHMIDRGSTTIWETWKESDNTFSNCHPMFGTVTEWYYRWLAGIRPDPDYPGFQKFILAPEAITDLDFVNCSYHSPYGEIVSNWTWEESDVCRYEVSIPPGSKANVILSIKESQSIELKDGETTEPITSIANLQSGQFELGEGSYTIRVKPKTEQN